MQKDQFVDLNNPWWLVQPTIDSAPLQSARDQLGQNLAWDVRWYEDPYKVEELYHGIEARGSQLLVDLDQATDEASQLAWIEQVLQLTQPAAAAPTNAEPANAQPATEAATAVPAAEAAPAAPADPQWDANWGMFTRYENGNYEYALSNVMADGPGAAAPAGQPDGKWHQSTDAAGAARQEVMELKATYQEIAADPEAAGITPEVLDQVLSDPAFQANLAEAEKQLDEELERALAESEE